MQLRIESKKNRILFCIQNCPYGNVFKIGKIFAIKKILHKLKVFLNPL